MNPIKRHSICRWTFNSGKGGFVPGDIRPAWTTDLLPTEAIPALIAKEIRPRLPDHIRLGFEVHFDYEINHANAAAVSDELLKYEIPLAMITPGAHAHFAYGGLASLDPEEREAAARFGEQTVDLAYAVFRKNWEADEPPSFVLWNGSWGYDLSTVGVAKMYKTLKASLAQLVKYEQNKGGELYLCIEPKPNEGHPAMMPPTVASAIVLWHKVASEFGLDGSRLGVNKETGHSEMIGLDAVYDSVEEIDNKTLFHTHLNSQGYNDGLLMGGPGKYDIDFGARITSFNITMARLYEDAGYARWYGHDMQARPYDDEQTAVERIVRSILSWEACEQVSRQLDVEQLEAELMNRRTNLVEDRMNAAVCDAQRLFQQLMQQS